MTPAPSPRSTLLALFATGLGLAAPAAPQSTACDPLALFCDATAATGLDFEHFNGMSGELYFPENMGAGVALFDFDSDGDLDLYLPQGHMLGTGRSLADATLPAPHDPPFGDRLYRNDLVPGPDGQLLPIFVDVTETSGLRAWSYGMGVATGDYDNDGNVDLYVTNYGPNQLWRNRGDGTFEDATLVAGVAELRWSVPAAFLDFDRDGWLDLFVGNYVGFSLAANNYCPDFSAHRQSRNYCGALTYPAERDRLFRNRGDGTFDDVTASAGIIAATGRAMGIVTGDFDDDGWTDIYVANDATENHLWVNQGNGTFREEAVLAGCAVNLDGATEAGMGVGAGDFDGDGDEDLLVAHLTAQTNTLYRNLGGLFRDDTTALGLATPSWKLTGFGAGFADFDRDGWLDLLVVNGAVEIQASLAAAGDAYPLDQPNSLYWNRRGEGFEPHPETTGAVLSRAEVSRGAAIGDLDNDGDPDVVVTNNAGPARVYLTSTDASTGWIGAAVRAPNGPDLDGARVVVTTSDLDMSVWPRTDGSYASARDPRVLVGTAGAAAVDTIVVTAPPRVIVLERPPRDRYLRLGIGEPVPALSPARRLALDERVAAQQPHLPPPLDSGTRPRLPRESMSDQGPNVGSTPTGKPRVDELVITATRASRDGRLEDAIAAYQQLVERQPGIVTYRQRLARTLLDAGLVDESIEASREALASAPDDALTHYTLGLALLEQDRSNEAIIALRAATTRAPDLRSAQLRLGEELAKTRQDHEAIAAFSQVLAFDPFSPRANLGRARSRARLAEYEEALVDFGAVLDVTPENLPAALGEMGILVHLGRLDDADSTLSRRLTSMTVPSSQGLLLFNLGDVARRRGHLTEARDRYELASVLQPAHRPLLLARARLLATAPDAAIRDGETAFELTTTAFEEAADSAAAEVMAMSLAALGQFDEAVEWQQELIRKTASAKNALKHRLAVNLSRYQAGQIALPSP